MNKPTFESTVNILVQAYFDGTLTQGHPCGCGCGNIIASIHGIKVSKSGTYWEDDCIGSGFDWYRSIYPDKIHRGDILNGQWQIESTGYTALQFASIERAFEDVNKMPDGSYREETEDSIFSGLMAIVDVLAEIHNVDLTVKENAKLLFVKP